MTFIDEMQKRENDPYHMAVKRAVDGVYADENDPHGGLYWMFFAGSENISPRDHAISLPDWLKDDAEYVWENIDPRYYELAKLIRETVSDLDTVGVDWIDSETTDEQILERADHLCDEAKNILFRYRDNQRDAE